MRSPTLKYLVLEGGGVKGIAYGGAILALEEAGLMKEIKGVAGSSAGSQAAAMIATGYSGREIVDELLALDFTMFLSDGSWNPLADVHDFINKYGWFSGETATMALEDKILSKTGIMNATMEQLHSATGFDLRVTSVDVVTRSLVYITRETFPTMPVSTAVRASSSIPYFFRPVRYGKHVFVDGGCIRNLPHDAFPESSEGGAGKGSVMALSLRDVTVGDSEVGNIFDFTAALAETVVFGQSSANRLVDDEDDENLDLIKIDSGDVKVVDFNLGEEEKVGLIIRGYESVNDRLRSCGYEGVKVGIPAWLEELRVAAGKVGKDGNEGGMEGANDYGKRLREFYGVLEEYGVAYKDCVESKEGIAYGSCGIKTITGVRGDGLMEVLGELRMVVRKDERLMWGMAGLGILGIGIICLAVIGVRARLRERGYIARKQKKEKKR
eukprot:CAMPEP_0118634888 /NCGR_PEP_ID=MMETSP0785-20121206/1786_1 /TAXON_ID=91992 /ORGANISM="Bolidomonas pacifica, Strain CCMP 1866" /LENGTH=438 /DNA_ID=CAMNT_0006525891 /DNA_START=305 /DNA_END=1622 /DNA_ORIENTATION=-